MNQHFEFKDDHEITEWFARNENKLKLINFIDYLKKKYLLENTYIDYSYDSWSTILISGRLIYCDKFNKFMLCSYQISKEKTHYGQCVTFKFGDITHKSFNINDQFMCDVELNINKQINSLNEVNHKMMYLMLGK